MDSNGAAPEPSAGTSVSSSFQYPRSAAIQSLLDESSAFNHDNGDNTRTSVVKATVSEEEDYLSGEEEFQMALDKPVLDEAVGENIRDGNIDASEEVEPVSGVILGDDGGVRKGNQDVMGESLGDGLVTADSKEDEVGGEGRFDEEREILDLDKGAVGSGGEIVDGNPGNVMVDKVETNGDKSEKEKEIASEPQEKVVSELAADRVEMNGDKSEKEKESGSEPQEKVVSEVAADRVGKHGDYSWKEGESRLLNIGDKLNEPQEKVVSEVVAEKVEVPGEASEKQGESGFGDELSEGQEKVVPEVVVVEPEGSQSGGPGDANALPAGDSVVDTIEVDAVHPGVAVVGQTEENGHALPEVVVVEPEESQSGGTGDANALPAGDSVVDTIEVDVVHPGVAVVGRTEENGHAANKPDEKDILEVVVDESAYDPLKNSAGADEDVVKLKVFQTEYSVAGVEKDEKSNAGAAVGLENGVHTSIRSNNSVVGSGILGMDDKLMKPEVDYEPTPVFGGFENGTANTNADGNAARPIQTNGEHTNSHAQNNGLADGISEESKQIVSAEPRAIPEEIREVEDEEDGVHLEDYMSDGDTDGIFGGSEAANKFIEQLERESGEGPHTGADSSVEQSQRVDGEIVTDSEEEGESDDGGDEKESFDSAALAALLRAATGADSGSNGITITSQDGSKLFTVERPAGLGSSLQSLRPAPRPSRANLFSALTAGGGGESEDNLSEEEKKKLEKLQHIRVKFLRLVHRLGLSPDESVAAQVLHRLLLLGGRHNNQTFSLDAAKNMALQLEAKESDDLDFSVNILVIGKSGGGKSATINSLFGVEKAFINAFETGTASAQQISGIIDGVKVQAIDTPGLKTSLSEQGFNRSVLSSVKKITKKNAPDVVLYVDRLDAQSRDLNDLPLLKTVTNVLGTSIWRNAIVTLTHSASAPPDGPSGAPLSYEVYVSQRSHVVQQSIGHAVGDIRMMSPSLMSPVSLVENHPYCRTNREGQKILPNGQSWRPQLLLLCYSMKILAEASSLSKQQDTFDHRRLFGFRARSPPLPYMLSSMLQSRPHPKLPSDQGGDDSDIDLDDLSDSDQEDEDEYDHLPPFKPLKKAQVAKLSREQKKAYFDEYDYRVKLLQKKQWKEELKRMREMKKKGKDAVMDYGSIAEDDTEPGAAPVTLPLPDMTLPPSFDGDNATYRYRFLEPVSSFIARPVLESHGWDHDCGYDGVNLEHSLAIASRFPVAYTVQVNKDKKDFSINLDSSISAKHGEKVSSMAGFDVQAIGKQLAYTLRAEIKFKNLKRNKAACGASLTYLGENVVPGVKVEDQISLGKQYILVGSAGAVRWQHDTVYGANFELQRRELDYPIGQVQSTLGMSVMKLKGDLALGFNGLVQLAIGRNSKVAVRAGINNKLSGQVTVRTSSSEHLSLALVSVIPTVLSIYRKVCPDSGAERYSIY